MASRMPHLPGSPRRLAAALAPCSSPPGMPSIRGEASPSARGREAGVTALCGGLRQALKASAIFHRPKPQNPLKPGDRAALVALAEILEAGHFDDVGDVNQAADHSERKATRDGEGDPILQGAPWSDGAATINESKQP